TDGRVRAVPLRCRHARGRPRRGGGAGVLGRRWRRHDRRTRDGRRHRADRLRLDGRRRVPRVPRRPAAPGRRGAHRGAGVRTPVVIGNWKMHGTIAEARVLAGAIREAIRRPRGVQVVVCPPFTALAAVAEVLAGSPIQLGAQTCHHEPAGAHTGEISAPMPGEVHGYLRGLLSELASKEAAQSVRILYGGSVKAENADALVVEPEIDGALVGGASLNAPGFVAIVRKAARSGTAPKE